jgi:hypothetical protein
LQPFNAVRSARSEVELGACENCRCIERDRAQERGDAGWDEIEGDDAGERYDNEMPFPQEEGAILDGPRESLVPESRKESKVNDINLVAGGDPLLREPNNCRGKEEGCNCSKEGTKMGHQECDCLRVLSHETGEPRTSYDTVTGPDYSEQYPRPAQHDEGQDEGREI